MSNTDQRNSSNRTNNLHLSQFSENDTPKWLQDYNADMHDIDAAVAAKLNISDLLDKIYRVGSIYESTTLESPATFIGGEWESFGAGQVLVGVGTAPSNQGGKTYNIDSTGGASTVTLNENQIPHHTHGLGLISTASRQTNLNRLGAGDDGGININGFPNTETAGKGGDQPHENMPPYKVVYRWRRKA